ncbi:MAG: hypothetical protein MUO85_02695, partial [candidate division Zixibacteria bacterium]|nr:hypothetical protein [candidate division Zixibacteria bacterium]
MENQTKSNNLDTLQSKSVGTWGKMFYVFFSPSQTFQTINRKPNWLLPLLMLLIAMVVYQLMIVPVRINDAKEKIRNNPNLSAEQIEMGLKNVEKFSEGPMF